MANIHERLIRVQTRLRRLRVNRRVLDEQVAHLRDVADAADARRLAAHTPLADREWQQARIDLERHRELLGQADRELEGLLRERDRLLDRLLQLRSARPPRRPAARQVVGRE